MDIKPPTNWRSRLEMFPQKAANVPVEQVASETAPANSATPSPFPSIDLPPEPPQKYHKRWWLLLIPGVLVALIGGAFGWYTWAVQPRESAPSTQRVTIDSGETAAAIATMLEQEKIIRSGLAFQIYCRLNGSYQNIKAGSYILSSDASVSDIVRKLVNGEHGSYNVIILPGMTLKQLADPTIPNSLAAQGFSQEEITQAFSASYDSPLLQDKPADATLEGYIFPETYQLTADESLESLFKRTFDELYNRLEADHLIDAFKARNLNLHQAITLASIIEKEANDETEQKQVAQVFLRRLDQGMVLGSDVTFIYAAAQMGVEPSVTLDSPYNTRKYPGLPPGPIANMNYSALEAVAHPADGDYLFFVAGDDGHIYFTRTEAEHDQAVAEHCKELCSLY